MENLKQDASKLGEEIGMKLNQTASSWSPMIKDLVDKLTGKDMKVTYDFQDLHIDIPQATGPDGKEIGSAKWKINGKFKISTEVKNKVATIE